MSVPVGAPDAMRTAPRAETRAAWRRLGFAVAGALLAFGAERGLIALALHRDLAMAVLASGGRLSGGELALAATLLLARLFVVLIVPALLLQSTGLCVIDLVRARRAP